MTEINFAKLREQFKDNPDAMRNVRIIEVYHKSAKQIADAVQRNELWRVESIARTAELCVRSIKNETISDRFEPGGLCSKAPESECKHENRAETTPFGPMYCLDCNEEL